MFLLDWKKFLLVVLVSTTVEEEVQAFGVKKSFGKNMSFFSSLFSSSKSGSSSRSINICPEIGVLPETPGNKVAVVACGCFWHPQPSFQQMNGVVRCVVGYAGGEQLNPTYASIKDATESLLVEYNPDQISYTEILQEWSNNAAPTYPQKAQYKSAIFLVDASSSQEKEEANEFLQQLQASSQYKDVKKLYVDVYPIDRFYKGEEYHQNFLQKQRQGMNTYS